MVKKHNSTVIKILDKRTVNMIEGTPEDKKPYVIEQIEYAYDDLFIVELRKKE